MQNQTWSYQDNFAKVLKCMTKLTSSIISSREILKHSRKLLEIW